MGKNPGVLLKPNIVTCSVVDDMGLVKIPPVPFLEPKNTFTDDLYANSKYGAFGQRGQLKVYTGPTPLRVMFTNRVSLHDRNECRSAIG